MSNCYIIGSEVTKEGIIVDPGADPESIISAVEGLGLDIKLIVITHGHPDHVGAVAEVKEATGAEVVIHADDAGSLRWISLRRMLGLSHPSPPDRLLKDGDSIDVGDLHFTVLHTPGHSRGGICLLGHGVVFSGDTLLKCS